MGHTNVRCWHAHGEAGQAGRASSIELKGGISIGPDPDQTGARQRIEDEDTGPRHMSARKGAFWAGRGGKVWSPALFESAKCRRSRPIKIDQKKKLAHSPQTHWVGRGTHSLLVSGGETAIKCKACPSQPHQRKVLAPSTGRQGREAGSTIELKGGISIVPDPDQTGARQRIEDEDTGPRHRTPRKGGVWARRGGKVWSPALLESAKSCRTRPIKIDQKKKVGTFTPNSVGGKRHPLTSRFAGGESCKVQSLSLTATPT